MKSYNEAIFQTHFEKILQCERTKKPADFTGLVAELKQKLSSNHSIKSLNTNTANFPTTFATLQGTSDGAIDERRRQNSSDTMDNQTGGHKRKGPRAYKGGPNKKRRHQQRSTECPCGRGCTTSWFKCYYLTPSAAPASFEPNPEIVNRIKDLREARPGLDKALKAHEEKLKDTAKKSAGATYYGSTFATNGSINPD
ncbi:hypothetical protein K3495_g16854, partial [Podosphaera aphanis]